MKPYVIGIDIGGTNMRIAAVCQDGSILHQHITSSNVLSHADDPTTALGDAIAQFMGLFEGELWGICVGFPGTVGRKQGVVYSCPLYPCFSNTQVAAPLTKRFHVPVQVEHDVILLMTYDLLSLPLQEMSCIMGVYLGTGVGNALWANGDFIYGADNVAGELGHVPTYGKTDPCPCGNPGCLEIYCSGKLLQRICQEHFPQVLMDFVFVDHGSDPVFDPYLDAVATAIAIEVNILNPDVVLLGGGVFHMAAFPHAKLQALVRSHTRKPFPHDTLRFAMTSSDKFAGAIGAAHYMWKQTTP